MTFVSVFFRTKFTNFSISLCVNTLLLNTFVVCLVGLVAILVKLIWFNTQPTSKTNKTSEKTWKNELESLFLVRRSVIQYPNIFYQLMSNSRILTIVTSQVCHSGEKTGLNDQLFMTTKLLFRLHGTRYVSTRSRI